MWARTMSGESETKPPVPWVLIAVIVVIAGAGAYMIRNVMSDDSPAERNHIAAVTLMKPPVDPPVKPPAPSPVIQERQAVLERILKVEDKSVPVMRFEGQVPRSGAQERATADAVGVHDDPGGPPAGDTLGVDAEGGAGGDSFGLVGRKGGRSILARTGGGGFAGEVPLLARFGGYIKIVTSEIKEKVIKRLDEGGGIPQGKHQCTIRVKVDKDGKIIDYHMTSSSGNNRMDQAVINALHSSRISEPPPENMPKIMDIMILSEG